MPRPAMHALLGQLSVWAVPGLGCLPAQRCGPRARALTLPPAHRILTQPLHPPPQVTEVDEEKARLMLSNKRTAADERVNGFKVRWGS